MFILVKLFWKLYFVFLIAFSIYFSSGVNLFSISEYIDSVMILISLIGLFGFAFEKKILFKSVWRLFFITLIAWDFYYHFIIRHILFKELVDLSDVFIFELVILPMYVGLFIYSYIKE